MHLDGTPIGSVDQAIGDVDVFGFAATKTEHRPARRERAICHGHIFATAEEGAGIVLAFNRAIADVNVLSADEMESVVIAVHAVVDMNAREIGVIRLDYTDGVIRAIEKRDIPDADVLALMK